MEGGGQAIFPPRKVIVIALALERKEEVPFSRLSLDSELRQRLLGATFALRFFYLLLLFENIGEGARGQGK